MKAPREDLVRAPSYMRTATVPVNQEMRAENDGKTMVGYPIVFNVWTEINSWEGKFRESIAEDALTKTLKERAEQVVIAFNHGYDPSVGDKPIAVPDVMTPDDRGLWTESPFIDRPYAEDIRVGIAQGAIKGMSFRFSVVREEWNEDTEDGMPERTIKELRLYEFGPVTYPAYEATVVGVRSQAAYALWRNANQAERLELLRQFGLSTDLSDSGAGDATPDDETDAPPAGAPVAVSARHQQVARQVRHYLKENS